MIKRLLSKTADKLIRPENIALNQWLKNLAKPTLNGKRVLITALRNKTWIEWAVYTSCVLRQLGYETILLYDSKEVSSLYGLKSKFWTNISEVPFIDKYDVQSFGETPNNIVVNRHEIQDYIYDAIAYDYHLEQEDIKSDYENFKEDVLSLVDQSRKAEKAIKFINENHEIHVFICYSGLIGVSPALLKKAIDLSIKCVCVEGWAWRKGHMIYNFNAPALEYNIRGWMEYYGWGNQQEETIEEYIGFQEGKSKSEKKWLKGFHNVQLAEVSDAVDNDFKKFLEKYPQSFLLAPNVIGDSSTLNRETIFESQQFWIKDVVNFFKKNPNLSLIIRAHPAEVWVHSKIAVNLGKFALEHSKDCPNIYVIQSDEKINTFALVPFLKCGLVWLSSIGVDLVVRNIPVICAASPKYSKLGIVKEPINKEEYFSTILDLSKGEVSTSEAQKIQAKKYLYTVFKGFSFPAHGIDYRAKTLRLNQMPDQIEHDKFYKILVEEVPAPDLQTNVIHNK